MDFVSALKVAGRRWYLSLGLFAIVALIVLQVVGRILVGYQATGSVLVMAPFLADRVTTNGYNANPYNDLEVAAYVLGTVASGQRFHDELAARGATQKYTIAAEPNKPIVDISVSGRDAGKVQKTYQAVVATLSDEMQLRQTTAGVPTEAQVAVNQLAAPVQPSPAAGGKRFMVLAVGMVLAAMAAIWGAVGADVLIERRRRTASSDLPGSRGQPGLQGAQRDHEEWLRAQAP